MSFPFASCDFKRHLLALSWLFTFLYEIKSDENEVNMFYWHFSTGCPDNVAVKILCEPKSKISCPFPFSSNIRKRNIVIFDKYIAKRHLVHNWFEYIIKIWNIDSMHLNFLVHKSISASS